MGHFNAITESRLYSLLKSNWGYDTFRYPQKDVILNIIKGHSTLAVMPTGSGKSLCYQLLSLLSRDIILVVTPLIALMDDQVEQALSKGIKASCLHSSLKKEEQEAVIQKVKQKNIQLLFVSPERLQVDSFVSLFSMVDISLMVVDEAHCISQWGHDFRPSYLQIDRFIQTRKEHCILALTATAPMHVQRDIRDQLSINKNSVYTTSLYRTNLQIKLQYSLDKRDVIQSVLQSNICSIVYLRHRKHVELLCEQLNSVGIHALPYHAGLDSSIRKQNQHLWMDNAVNCMVSTNAFGMGINKADVRMVIHYKAPSSIEDYIQEIGRAGRDGKESQCILLYNHKDLAELSAKADDLGRYQLVSHKRSKKGSLLRMVGLIKRDMCRYRYLLDYFDEDMNSDCGKCDFCMKRINDAKPDKSIRLNYFSGQVLIDTYVSKFPVSEQSYILKELNKLINEGKMKLKGAYLAWTKAI